MRATHTHKQTNSEDKTKWQHSETDREETDKETDKETRSPKENRRK